MIMLPDRPFSVTDDLPQRGLVIEASAGTGKTHALADLATRFLAESDVLTSELLVVTFTRAATNQLRARVRDRLIEVVDGLELDRTPGEDPVLDLLASGDRAGHLLRLRTAIADYDALTIATIHGFAAQVRNALGVTTGLDPDARLVEETDELIGQVCADVLAAAAMDGRPPDDLPTAERLRRATRHALGRPGIRLEPDSEAKGATPAQVLLRDLVDQTVTTVAERRRMTGTVSFDGVVSDLWNVLDGARSAAAIESIRSRFKVALIDEFQDTDPVQWKIFRKVFGERVEGSLILVGDPKQAIYGFRGSDIETYVDAVNDTGMVERRSMSRNWRSDSAVIAALDALFAGASFGDEAIRFQPVVAARETQARGITTRDGDPLPALSLRLAVGKGIDRTKAEREVAVGAGADAIERDLVGQVRWLLDHAALPDGREGSRPVRPHDIAILVNTNQECTGMRDALHRQGVPAVVARGGNVLASPAADQVRRLLHAMARPSDPGRARSYALSWFGGWSAERVAAASDADLARMQEDLRDWSDRLATDQVADVLARVWSASGVVAEVLATPDGDRNMTDLEHVAELLHGATPSGRSNVAGLLATLDGVPDDDVDAELERDKTARRIESEAEAVQVMTVWSAKGLEFPVVCVPMAWRWNGGRDPVIYLDPVTNRQTYDLANGTTWPTREEAKERKERAASTMAGERLRLLYVALTRAQHHTIVWWANGQSSAKTALAKVLFARTGGAIDPDIGLGAAVAVPSDDEIVAELGDLIAASGGTIAADTIDHTPLPRDRWVDASATGDPSPLESARFTTRLDRTTRRWSFSAITDQAATAIDPHDPTLGDGAAADERSIDFEGDGPDGSVGTDPDVLASRQVDLDRSGSVGRLTRLPAGTAFGTLVHAVFEQIDFSVGTEEMGEQIGAALDAALSVHPVDLTPVDGQGGGPIEGRRLLIDGIIDALGTSLGPMCHHRRLGDIGTSDRLDELAFDFRLAAADRAADLSDVGRLVVAHLEPNDPLAAWAAGLAKGGAGVQLAGHLTGSIDLVLRTADPTGSGDRYVVVDYKTNALGGQGRPALPDDYRRSQMNEAMVAHDYPLQALLYSVCLHRYLRWRLPGYRPERHLGGAVYLFVRGMVGSATQAGDDEPDGVFGWPIPSALVEALSDLLDGHHVGELRR